MTTCATCARDRPEADKFCRYCGVEVDRSNSAPLSTPARTVAVFAIVALAVLTGLWLQFRPVPIRPSEVSGQRQSAAIDTGSAFDPDQEAHFAKTESLLSAETGDLVVIPAEMDEAIILSGVAPRRRIALPPATRWEITDDALIGFTDDVHANVVRLAAPDQVIETKAQNVYTDLNGELLHTWQDRDHIRVLPVLADANALGGQFAAAAPIVATRPRATGPMIGPLLTTYDGDTYGWNGDGKWQKIAVGVARFATDPLVTTVCDGRGAANDRCETHFVDLRSGRERSGQWTSGTSTFAFIVQEGGFASPDLAYVLTAAGRTLVDITDDSTRALSVPSRSRDNTALWALDSSMVGVAGEGLRLFDTRGAILVDAIAVDTTTGPRRGVWTVTARFVRHDVSGPS